MSDNQFGPPQPGFGPPQTPGAPTPPQGAPGVPQQQPGYGYPQPQQPQNPWGGSVPPQGYPAGAPGYPMGYPAPPRKSRKGLWITLSIVSAVILAGAGVVGYLAYDTVSKSGKNKLALPTVFQGMDSSAQADQAQEVADQIRRTAIESGGTPDGTTSAIYIADDQSRILQASGYWSKFPSPKNQLDREFSAMGKDGGTFEGRKSMDAGGNDGVMDCAIGTFSGEKLAFCLLADHSVVLSVVERSADDETSLDKVAADTRELRKSGEVAK
ncbi:hypothetical protein [Kitasatospora sp. NPDC057198]|uniref:hypothetical protein n=1 Tax=Kitasatospora sp. NPDC057198 TaxID=3346046 RepID=UPI00363CDB20